MHVIRAIWREWARLLEAASHGLQRNARWVWELCILTCDGVIIRSPHHENVKRAAVCARSPSYRALPSLLLLRGFAARAESHCRFRRCCLLIELRDRANLLISRQSKTSRTLEADRKFSFSWYFVVRSLRCMYSTRNYSYITIRVTSGWDVSMLTHLRQLGLGQNAGKNGRAVALRLVFLWTWTLWLPPCSQGGEPSFLTFLQSLAVGVFHWRVLSLLLSFLAWRWADEKSQVRSFTIWCMFVTFSHCMLVVALFSMQEAQERHHGQQLW